MLHSTCVLKIKIGIIGPSLNAVLSVLNHCSLNDRLFM